MLNYCISTVVCSALLFLLYKMLLENEKMHSFKRFYLLFSIVFSVIAPLITITIPLSVDATTQEYIYPQPLNLVADKQAISTIQDFNWWAFVLPVIYVVGLAWSLLKFTRNFYYFFKSAKNCETIFLYGARLVLLEKDIIPHSFLNFIFLNKEAYKNRKIEKEIIAHEFTHVKQYHSLDILFAQLIQSFYWFNPFLIGYTKAIQLNHEFLADEAVIKSLNNPLSYQHLLIRKASGSQQLSLASSFNYSIIKKRLVMITKNTSPQMLVLKKLVVIPLFLVTLFLFVQKASVAQKVETGQTKKEVPSTTSGASVELMNEYKTIVEKHESKNPKGFLEYSPFSEEEKERLLTIFQMMSKEQQNKQNIIFRHKFSHFQKAIPTQAQLQSWMNPNMYGVWIGERRIKNSELANYKPSDFDHYFASRLSKTAKNYGKHYFQINLMTKEQYAKYVKEWEAEPSFLLTIRNGLLHFGNKHQIKGINV